MLTRALKHLFMFTGAMSASLVAYHLAVGFGGFESGSVRAGSAQAAVGDDSSVGYRLSELRLFDRTRYFIRERYVEPERIDPEAMFDAALDMVEREVDSVLLSREPGGSLLHVSVGAYTTTLPMEPLQDLDDLASAVGKVTEVLDERLADPEVEHREVEYALINGMLSTLDPHSVLMSPDDSQEMNTENQGEFGGLGITITVREGRLTVEYPLEDTPAYRAGLKAGDHIVRIEEESTINMTLPEAVSKLRGPVGEPVTIMVMRDIFDEARPFTIVRDLIRINPVEGELLEGGIGYVRIKAFHANTSRDLDAVLAGFRRDLGGAPQGLILDLRDNAGGYLTQAVEVADRFLESGVVVATVAANGRRDTERASSSRTEPSYPMVVLNNAHSASASEIVAGALRKLDRAAVLGERSFGKGSVQHLYENADQSQLKLTVAEYLTAGENSIQSVGITPDVELVPQVVHVKDAEEGDGAEDEERKEERVVFLFWRERVVREADLDRHLGTSDQELERAAYRISYLRDVDADEENRRRERRDLSRDWEVQFAREVLLGSEGARRADVVAASASVVSRRQQEEADRVQTAFEALGIDWSAGPQPEQPQLELRLDLGEDGVLLAGEGEDVTVHVTNTGEETVYQVMAVTESDNERMDGYEYFFGRIDPGQELSYVQQVTLDHGYLSEMDHVRFLLRDASGRNLGERDLQLRTQGRGLPRLAYSFKLRDDCTGDSQGNGNGVAEVGETIDLEVEVSNVGDTDSAEVFAKIRNKAGADLDLRIGTVELGSPGPGETVSGRFTFQVRGAGETGQLPIEFLMGDNELYDYGAVIRAGFYEYISQREELVLPVALGAAELASRSEDMGDFARQRNPPQLEITRQPDLVVRQKDVVLSGVVRDDAGVRDVIVFHSWFDSRSASESRLGNERKIYYSGGEGAIKAIPFTVEPELREGANTLVILAHDATGLSLARSVNVYYDPQPQVSQKQQP